ncbi:MAG: ZIP family metal transporter [Parvularculaceae bacterium]
MNGQLDIPPGLVASIIAACVSTAGLLSMAALGDWGRRNSAYFSAFAIGVLLVAVLFHLTPEALAYSPTAWRWGLGGFLVMLTLGFGIRIFTRRSTDKLGLAIGYASIIALGFHSFVDGLIYEVTFHAEWFTGGLATLGLLLHEFPEGVIAFFLVREAGMSRNMSALLAFIAASVTTVAGAVIAGAFIENIDDVPFGPMLGVAAGGLVYIMIFHLGPHASLTPHKRGYMMASIGVATAMAALVLRHH